MNDREEQIYKHFMARYKEHWDMNQYARTNYDTDFEAYRGYRDASKYPLAYSYSFNRVLPIIHTILSRFMDQLYQSGNVVSVKPRKKKDIERAKSVEAVLNFQLENLNCTEVMGGSYMTMFKWFFNALTYGKGIVKCYWKKEERISPRRMAIPIPKFDRMGNLVGLDAIDHISQEMQTVYDGPYVEVLHNKLFLPHIEYRDIQKMPQCFIIYQRSLDYVKQMADKGVYKNLNELPYQGSGAGSESRDSREAFVKGLDIEGAHTWDGVERSDYQSPTIDIIEGYGRCILEDTPYEVGSGYQIKGKEEEVIVHIGNYMTILSLQKNPYGVRPLFDVGCYYHPELYWDLGMVTLTRGIQDQVNDLANLRIQNVMMMINPMIKVQESSDIPPEALVWRPFGILPVGDMNEVEPMVMPDYHSNLFAEQESFYNSTIQDIMGMYCLHTDGSKNDYEILTDEGWKRFDELNKTEKVMTLNYETDEMSFELPEEYIEYPEKERELYVVKGENAEFICSPDHRLPLISNGKKKIIKIKDIKEESYSSHAIPIAGFKWVGDDNYQLPFDGICKEDWCAFMGIWIAEGHASLLNGAYQIGVAQDKKAHPEKYQAIKELLERLPFNFRENGNQTQFYTYNKELYLYLKHYGKSSDKFVPGIIKISSVKFLNIFLDWYLMGDGSNIRNERRFTTISKQLADDIQEIAIKVGLRASIRFNEPNKWVGEITTNHRNMYLQGNKAKQVITKQKIKGRLTCLRVPNGIFLIRVNNKPVWTGNSYNMGQTPERQERVGTVYCLATYGNENDYEILTDSGWKKYDELDCTEKVMTLNYETDEMEWQKPTEYIEFPEEERELIHFNTYAGEFLCTKDHRLPIEMGGRLGFEKRIVKAGDLSQCSHARIPCCGKEWIGDDEWIVPFNGISKEDWASFIGIFLSEGHTYHNKKQWSYQVAISQEADSDKVERINQLISRLPFHFVYNGHQWKTQNKLLYEYLVRFGKSKDKYVPKYLKNASKKIINTVLEWMELGDGHLNHAGQRCYTTISKQLADDYQEMALKIGKRANIWLEKRSEENEKWADVYHVGLSNSDFAYWYHNGRVATRLEKHTCRVTCLRVPNGIFLIRVNNKPIWTGNSIQSMGEARAKLMLMSMDYVGIRPLLKYMMLLNTFHLPGGFEYRIGDGQQTSFGNIFGEDIHADYDFAARYTSMEPALGKQARAQQLVQMAGMWAQSPWVNQYQFNKVIMELLDIREADYLLKTPEQYAAEVKQQTQMALMAEQAKKNFETTGKLKVGQQEYMTESALSEQEFKQELVLTALDNEATKDIKSMGTTA